MMTKSENEKKNIFHCKKCDYTCYKKSIFDKHLLTLKHRKVTNGDKKVSTQYTCECGKEFSYRQGLHRHKQKCSFIQDSDPNSNIVLSLLKDNNDFKNIIIQQQQDRVNLQKESLFQQEKIVELQSQLMTIVKNQTNVVNQTNITNYNNQRFNLNIFLNEECKDAMNIEDFIESLELEPSDIAETGRLGYVEGISRIFMNKLNQLDVYNRPLHCTDLKRETIYIKEDNKWEKDNDRKDKLQRIVEQVAEKNYEQLPMWQQQNPKHLVTNTQECEQFMEIACNVLGGGSDEETMRFRSRIMRNILKEITIDKT
tara:strand:- start:106 stop:1041 length:936 start_codon:yes stop_codon:yes gene_type:complete